jgi:AbrB family looped-hinge helix DNA binding protein
METKISSKGQVVLPSPLRRKLSILAGDSFDISIQAGSILLTPHRQRPRRSRIVTDPLTGLPALSAGPGAPVLTSKEVEEMLADFP